MPVNGILDRINNELGITTLRNSTRDVYLLLFTRFVRMYAYGSIALILALYLAALGHSDTKIGLFMTLTLVGDVLISLALTFVADSLGRRRIVIVGAILMTVSGVCFATISNYWILLVAAVVGVISPSGNEIGPFRAVEESTLAHLSEAKTRPDIFAWYVVIGTLGTAGGTLVCGWITQGLQSAGWQDVASYRFIFWIYAVIGLIKAGVSLLLSSQCEVEPEPSPASARQDSNRNDEEGNENESEEENEPFLANDSSNNNRTSTATPQQQTSQSKKKKWAISQISPASRTTLLKLCSIFFFDSLASGMVPQSLIAFYLERKFSMPDGQLGSLMSAAQFTSSIGNIFASSVAKRVGLVRAMVFTHLPAAIMLALLPAPSSLVLTIVLLVARASLASMDQAPRTAFLAAVVLPNERTAIMGIVNTVKTMSQSSGPLITGLLAGGNHFWVAFLLAGALKASYDVGMLTMFVNMRLEGDKPVHRDEILRDAEDEQEFEIGEDEEEDEPTDLEELEPRSIGR